jgi:two-component sensor histidine kinase
MTTPAEPATSYSVTPRVAALSIVLFWLFYYLTVSLRSWIMHSPGYEGFLDNRAWVALAGMGFTWLLYLGLRRLDGRKLGLRVAAAFLGAVPVSTAYATVNYLSFYVYDPEPELFSDPTRKPKSPDKIVIENAVHWYSFIVAWATLYLALSYASMVRVQERETARLRGAAQSAELRALRYQVNPHFLFNTLNSVSALVMAGRNKEAEAMILNLSTFFRTSLSTAAIEDVRLDEEVALQRLYLNLESVRFPDRLRTEIVIPPELESACVPAMILQPLIENAIKYGVAPAQHRAALRIVASEFENGLRLVVENDSGAAGTTLPGTGTGLRNVADRLAARYGPAGELIFGPRACGGFTATLHMPLTRRGC